MFCGAHLVAPAAQRGGWLSAARRREQLGHKGRSSARVDLDASCIHKRLWIGALPPIERDLPTFDVLALCAQEFQPAQLRFTGRVLRIPIPDARLTDAELRRALHGGQLVGRELAAGRRVLVTCRAGLNRSALVAALALGVVTRAQGADVIEVIRARRSAQALSNPYFVEVINRFVGARRLPPRTRP